MMKKIIGVMGPGEKQARPIDLEVAYQVGEIIAKSGNVLLCGGMTGVMAQSAKGSKDNSGLTVGIGPTGDKNDMNQFVDIPLLTNMHAGRNYMNIISSDILIFVSVGSPGTLSELAFSIQMNKKIIIINGSKKLEEYIQELQPESLFFVKSMEELQEKYNELI